MRFFLAFLVAMLTSSFALAGGGGFKGEKFIKVVHCKFGGSSTNKGLSYDSAKPIADGDLWAIPAGTVIEKVYVIVDTTITGSTAITVGDDDGAASFVANFAGSFTAPAMAGWDAKTAGAYLRISTAGATDAADIYVVPNAKYYAADGKEVKLDNTTANTAGKFRVVIEGYYVGTP